MNTAADDWRRQGQEWYLQGRTFFRSAYRAPRPGWDHDHCEFCWAKFMEQPASGALGEGFVTVEGADERWVCPQCFRDFEAEFRFIVRQADAERPAS